MLHDGRFLGCCRVAALKTLTEAESTCSGFTTLAIPHHKDVAEVAAAALQRISMRRMPAAMSSIVATLPL